MKASTHTRSISIRTQTQREEPVINSAIVPYGTVPSHDEPALYEIVLVALLVILVLCVGAIWGWNAMTGASNGAHTVTCSGKFRTPAIANRYGQGVDSMIQDKYAEQGAKLPDDMDAMEEATLRLNGMSSVHIRYKQSLQIPRCWTP